MTTERYRPLFHFTARKNWLNDPNGLVYYDGIYHLFFQHNPVGLEWGNMTWGHAISRDLVRWKQVEPALEPDRLGTMFSGSAVVDWKNTSRLQAGAEKPIVLIYTAAGGTSAMSEGKPFTQCLAYSQDAGETWEKYAANPVMDEVRPGNRDPKVFWYNPSQQWIMTLYLDENDFALFSSPNLKQWTHLQTFSVPGSIECPDFFELPIENENDRRWVWIAGDGRYYVGIFDGVLFTAQTELLTSEWGANFYACQTFSDIPENDGRRIQIAWMRGGEYPDMPFNQQMSFPCELRLFHTPDGLRLSRMPVHEIENLYGHTYERDDLTVSQSFPIPGIDRPSLDIEVVIELDSAKAAGLTVNGQPIRYDRETNTLTCLGQTAPLHEVENRIRLRVLADTTSIEVFANNGLVSMTSCYLVQEGACGVELFSEGGTADFLSIQIHEVLPSTSE